MGESQKLFKCIRTIIVEIYNKHFMYVNLNNKATQAS